MRDLLAGEADDLMIVSHYPFLPALLQLMCGADAAFPQHGAVALERTRGGWTERWREPVSPHDPDAGRCAPESQLVARDLREVPGRLERLEIAHVAAERHLPAADEQPAADVAAPVVLRRVDVECVAGAGDVGTDESRTERDVRRRQRGACRRRARSPSASQSCRPRRACRSPKKSGV